MSKKDFQNGFALGLASGGVIEIEKEEQEKVIDIIENGTTEVTPDDGMTLNKVTVNVAIESGGEDTLRALLTDTLKEFTINDQINLTQFRLYPKSLKKFASPNLIGVGDYTFYGNNDLEYLDLGKITSLKVGVISGKHRLNALVLRNAELVPLSGTFSNAKTFEENGWTTNGKTYYCYIYVPKALIEDYKIATNWSNYANRFRAIEDYPEITGGII